MFAAEEIASMSRAERVDAMERLWESFSRDGIEYPSPAWHEPVLSNRTLLIESGGAEWLSLDELQMRLTGR